jgi:hypothetical protein
LLEFSASDSAWTLLIDELQYLAEKELAALIVALHRVSQKNLPIMLFGAGLPQIAALTGEAKSYAESLFDFPAIGPLEPAAARSAIRRPIEDEGEGINDDALDLIVARTEGYPFFLQEWVYQTWNFAAHSPFTRADVEQASIKAIERLDAGFFRVRFDRLTPKERDFVHAIAQLGKGPYRSGDVAAALGEAPQALGPRRAAPRSSPRGWSTVPNMATSTFPFLCSINICAVCGVDGRSAEFRLRSSLTWRQTRG